MSQAQDPAEIRQLLDQFPFLEDVYQEEVTGAASRLHRNVVPAISVLAANPSFMFRRADDVRGDGRSLLSSEAPDCVGTRFEYYRPVNREGKLGEIRNWLEWKEQFVRDLFTREMLDWSGWADPQDPAQVVSALVWVTRKEWYSEGTTFRGAVWVPTNQPIRTDVRITVYREPAGGWRQLYWSSDPLANVMLHGWQLFPGSAIEGPFKRSITDRLHRLAMEFQDRVWATGLGTVVSTSRASGMSGQFGDVKVTTFITAGRLVVQFERGNATLGFGGVDEPNPRLGFGNIEATLEQAEGMVRDVMEFWLSADPATRHALHQANPKVALS